MGATVINTLGQAVSSLGIGSEVVLRGDRNSPRMIVVSGVADNRGIQMGWACGWFCPATRTPRADNQGSTFNVIQLATEAIELAPQPERVQ